jgi:signal transduction histidine kinase
VVEEATAQTRHLVGDVALVADTAPMDAVVVNCQKRLIVQVLVNLIRNAVEAIGEKPGHGGGTIVVTHECQDGFVALRVRDDGSGMEPETVEKLFRFKYTTKKDGTGIGLHLSKMILKLHEGGISVESQRGVGTTFCLTLPLQATPQPSRA